METFYAEDLYIISVALNYYSLSNLITDEEKKKAEELGDRFEEMYKKMSEKQ